MSAFLAWLPFLAALVLAFAAGVVFARLNESWAIGRGVRGPGVGLRGLHRADIVLTTTLVALLVAVLLVWGAALLRFVR